PDVVLVGEIRDGETAQIAVQASLTGHLVLSTCTPTARWAHFPSTGYGRGAFFTRPPARHHPVTGPTGSGKSTTLYAALSRLDARERNIMTIEDPVEYELEGIGQTQVNAKVEMTFARGLRAILRQDPDVVLVGEIRDGETAQIAVQASLTGHLVLST
ncbi:hypothetical protein CQA48_29595, partial [Klebsiella pneumoniae]